MSKAIVVALAIAASAGPSAAQNIVLRDMGSFHVGGREVTLSGRPVRDIVLTPGAPPTRMDPNGTYQVEQMYAQYFLPAERRGRAPLLLWHGGGLTGVSFETTPDGREGWSTWFIRRGWDTYVSDAVERGRSGFAQSPDIFEGEPVFTTIESPFERFRIGAGPGSYPNRTLLPNSQFPMDGYANFIRQIVPRWTTTDPAIVRGYQALVDRVGPSVVLAHSQAGQFGWRVAQTRPDKVRALVLVEPSAVGDPALVEALRDIPVLIVYGDNIPLDARWPTIRRTQEQFVERVRAAGARVDIIDLPSRGLRGNSHMVMMDRNNLEVAQVIQDWLAERGLWQ